ncbi:HEAT repeat-containing protein 4-like [Oopsacas minuta]|uniref:HEAT repeat-containing protein 4-like n=1 Tax=Oopsacas minuta TaxID=111878 RepID=A0AAV7JNI8_9METZ|nr:HEAT repeat-containing protein 4-like [Oopsacas minuta]
MLRDPNIETTQHFISSERGSKEFQYLSNNLEFSENAAALFESSPQSTNRGFISWEDHYQFDSLENLLIPNRIQKRTAQFRKSVTAKQHVCHLEPPTSTQELTLPPIVKRNDVSMKSAGIQRVMSKKSNFSVHSIPMDPSVDWNNKISSAVDNFETIYWKSDSSSRLSPDTSISLTSPTARNSRAGQVPEFYTEWKMGHKPVFQPQSTITEDEILLENGLKFDKVLEPIHPARQYQPHDSTARVGKLHARTYGQRRWQGWPRPQKNIRSEGWLTANETRELEEEREEQKRSIAMSLANKKIDNYTSTTDATENTQDNEFFLEEDKQFKISRIIEEWLQKWNLPTQVSGVTQSDILQQLGSVNQLARLQGAALSGLSALRTQQESETNIQPQENNKLELHPQIEEQLYRLLTDEINRVRITAATVLSFSLPEDNSVIKKVLLEGITSVDTQERWLSCQALACMLLPDANVLTELSLRLVSDSSRERSRGLTLLAKLSPHSVVVHAIAGDLITGRHWKQKIAGCSLVPLIHKGPKRDLQDRLVHVMWYDWHSKVREAAARALGLSGNGKIVNDQIRAKLTDLENEDLRLDALHKIRKLKPPTHLLIPGLLSCLEDSVTSIRISCIKLIAELQIRDDDILDTLIEMLRDDNWKIKLESINSLSQLSGSVSSPHLIVSHLLWGGRYDRVTVVRISALKTLSKLAMQFSASNYPQLKEDIVNALIEALGSDTEDSVREEAERGLLDLGEEVKQDDYLVQAIREEIRKIGQPADVAAALLQSF